MHKQKSKIDFGRSEHYCFIKFTKDLCTILISIRKKSELNLKVRKQIHLLIELVLIIQNIHIIIKYNSNNPSLS